MSMLRIGIRCFFTPGSGIRKISGSGMNIPDPARFETVIFFKFTEILMMRIRDLLDPGSGMEKIDPGSGRNIPDPKQRRIGSERKKLPFSPSRGKVMKRRKNTALHRCL